MLKYSQNIALLFEQRILLLDEGFKKWENKVLKYFSFEKLTPRQSILSESYNLLILNTKSFKHSKDKRRKDFFHLFCKLVKVGF